jgi:hypothetical protein
VLVRREVVIQESVTNLNVTGEIPLATALAHLGPGIAAKRKQALDWNY